MPSPVWKLYSVGSEYVGCMKYREDAAAMVSILGVGATVRYDHRLVVWTEGKEEFSASESYDRAGEIMEQRRYAAAKQAYDAVYKHGRLSLACDGANK